MAAHPDDARPPLGFLVVRIAEAVDRAFVAALTDLGLKPRHLRLLVLVDRAPGLSQRELARRLGVDAGNLVAVLDALEADGLLRRDRHEDDRRQRLVSLSPKGQGVLRRAVAATARAEAQVFGALPRAQQDTYYEMTLSIYEQLRGGTAPDEPVSRGRASAARTPPG